MRACCPQPSGTVCVPASGRGPPDMPEEASLPPAKRFRPGSCPPGRRVVMLLTAGGGGGAGGGRRQTPPLAQPSASPYREALELQRRSLPIFRARGQLLAQLRNLDNAVLIGEWRLWWIFLALDPWLCARGRGFLGASHFLCVGFFHKLERVSVPGVDRDLWKEADRVTLPALTALCEFEDIRLP